MGQVNNKTPDWRPAILLMVRVSGWIAGPVLAALFVGRYLDERWQTEPWLFLGLTGLAFIVSSWAIVRIATGYLRDLEHQAKQAKDHKDDNEQSVKGD